jgi:hypothetical protein
MAVQAEEKVVDSIQLSNCSIYAVTGAIKGREHCIDIYRSQPSKHYLFGADDEKDRHAWISAIKHARGDKVLGETPEQELVRRERETASKLTATLNWMHQLIREDQVQDVLKLLQDADKETPGVEREDDITSRDLVRSREPQAGHTLLHVAAAHGQLRLVKELVEVYRADINKPDKQSWSPLHTAAHHSQIDVFEYLVDRGASLYTTTANGSSPLHYLVRFTRSSPRGRATHGNYNTMMLYFSVALVLLLLTRLLSAYTQRRPRTSRTGCWRWCRRRSTWVPTSMPPIVAAIRPSISQRTWLCALFLLP